MKRRSLLSGVSINEIASVSGTTVIGGSERFIKGVCSLEAPLEDHITFLKVTSRARLAKLLRSLKNVAVIVGADAVIPEDLLDCVTVLRATEPYSAFLRVLPLFYEEEKRELGIHTTAIVSSSASLGKDVYIGAGCVIGERVVVADNVTLLNNVTLYSGCQIGSGTFLHSGVVVRSDCVIGKNCILHNNVVIGADGFGYVPSQNGELRKVPQVGRALIGDNVEIGANSAVDRGAFGDTIVGPGTKIDNLVQVGHNCLLGANVVLCAQCGLAGSTIIEDNVIVGGQVGIADHIRIASGSRLAGQTGVTGDLTVRGDYAGFPAVPARQWRRQVAALSRIAKTPAKGAADTIGKAPDEVED